MTQLLVVLVIVVAIIVVVVVVVIINYYYYYYYYYYFIFIIIIIVVVVVVVVVLLLLFLLLLLQLPFSPNISKKPENYPWLAAHLRQNIELRKKGKAENHSERTSLLSPPPFFPYFFLFRR